MVLERQRQVDQPDIQTKFQDSQVCYTKKTLSQKATRKRKRKNKWHQQPLRHNSKNTVTARHGGRSLKHSEGRGSQIFVSMRPAWSTKQIQDSQGYYYTEKPCLEKQNKNQTNKKEKTQKQSPAVTYSGMYSYT